MAKTVAPAVSPTSRMPCGAKVAGPADFNSGVPFFMPAVKSAAPAAADNAAASAAANNSVRFDMVIVSCVME